MAHPRFEILYALGDGTGRVDRILLNLTLHPGRFPLLDFPFDRRMGYYKASERASVERKGDIFLKWFYREYVDQYRPLLSRT